MLGAVIGDVIGSVFEFDRGPWTKDFALFTQKSSFTDDSVMTVAVTEALLDSGPEADEETVKKHLIHSMQKWGRTYPHAGYGARFIHWVFAKEPRPYHSFGNGSAMRVSSAGWFYPTLERTREVARWTAEVSHNHPEGIKGAECTAAVIFLARYGFGKQMIRNYTEKEFGYDIHTSLSELRKHHHHEETCMDALPKALVSFLEGDSYEDVIRNAVSLGGDTDTIACIAGAMAEAYYGIPDTIRTEALKRIPDNMKELLKSFEKVMELNPFLKRSPEERRNYSLEQSVEKASLDRDDPDRYFHVISELAERYDEDGQVYACMIDKNDVLADLDPETLKAGERLELGEMRLSIDTVKNPEGAVFMPVYTSSEEAVKNDAVHIVMNVSLRFLCEETLRREDLEGMMINPFGIPFFVHKDILKMFREKLG